MSELMPGLTGHAKKVILHVDDNPTTRYTIGRTLEREGFKVSQAVSGREGLRLAREADLIILDVKLPDIDGFEVCRRIKADPKTADIPVLHLSATYVTYEAQATGLEGGADGYLVQPVDERVLVATIKAMLRMRRAEEELHRIFTLSPDLLCVVGSDGYFKRVNPAFEDTLGYASRELLARPFVDFVHPEDREAAVEEVAKLSTDFPTSHFENRFRRSDGSYVWLEWKAVPVAKEGLIYAAARDVTESKQLHETLLEIREAERRRIARDLHDVVLQDLAAAVQGLQANQAETKDSARGIDLHHEINALRKAVSSLRSAIYDLRLEGSQPFVRAVEALVEFNRQLAPEREITLAVQDGLPPELPHVAHVEMLRVLREALVNVRRHSDAQHVMVALRKNRDMMQVSVTDDGRGFDRASVREGVGLSAMRERAIWAGGRLQIDSTPGNGTRVSVAVSL
ncbi:MAG TPA: PAS domain S-box protein [Rubrobacter sp.]|nr:PAS domain S-box protein [Rubrobacter sp.]